MQPVVLKRPSFIEARRQYEEIINKKDDANIASNYLAILLVDRFVNGTELNKVGELVKRFSTSNDPAYLDTYGWVQLKLVNSDVAISALG